MDGCCQSCGNPYTECHHVVFRSQAKYMVGVKINKIPLCPNCHRGDESPHKDRKKDLQYKLEMQAKLEKIFNQEYYTPKKIAAKLQLNVNGLKAVEHIMKTMILYSEGYKREDILRRCMGGQLYSEDDIEWEEFWKGGE